MILTRAQINRIYQATQNAASPDTRFYVEEDADGKLRFGVIEVIEKRRPIPLTRKETE